MIRINRRVRASTAALGTVAAAVAAAPAWAADKGETLDEVVITARNRKEAAQSVPVPVSVLGGKDLEQDASATFTDFARKLPSISVVANQPRQSSVAIRGIGKNNSGEAFEGSVGVLLDGVYLVHPGANWGNFIDLDRVEVARGPQGTLLGKNTTMGVINVGTRLPSFDKAAQLELGYGERKTVTGRGTVTGPLADGVLAYRATFGYEKGDGPIRNTYIDGQTLNDLNRVNGRFQLLATPSAAFSARLIFDVNRTADYNGAWPIYTADPAAYTNGVSRGANTYTARAARFPGYAATVAWNSFDTYAADNNAPLINESKGFSAELNWDLGGYSLTSITAARSYLFQPHNDYDTLRGSASEAYYGSRVDTTQKSQELRLASPTGGALDYQAGLYWLSVRHILTNTPGATYGVDSGRFLASSAQFNTLNASVAGRQLLIDALNGGQNTTTQNPSVDSLALYAQANWHVSDKATLTLGVRRTNEDRGNSFEASSNAAALPALTYGTAAENAAAQAIRNGFLKASPYRLDSLSESSTAWLVNPSVRLTPDVLAYASASYGEKSGAVQFNTSTGLALPHVKPERALDFELGFKSTLLDRRLRLNANLFQTDISDYQTQVRTTDDGGVTWTTPFANANRVVVRGLETEAAFAPNRQWALTASLAYAPARFKSWRNGVCPAETDTSVATGTPVCDNTGKRLVGASDLMFAVGADYRAPLGDGLFWRTFANSAYRSDYNTSPSLSAYGEQQGFALFDAGIGFGSDSKGYEIDLIGRNLFDKQYLVSVSDFSGTNPFRAAAGPRRFVGVTLKVRL